MWVQVRVEVLALVRVEVRVPVLALVRVEVRLLVRVEVRVQEQISAVRSTLTVATEKSPWVALQD